jgi:EAL domain-containing protein (putative c-di-GMP-specific phosphodiesterase class I)/ActR/RegA family two-component response regulator
MSARSEPATLRSVPRRVAYVLDDEPQIAAFVRHALTTHGYVAKQFSSVLPLLAEVKVERPELLVLDIALGQSDAVEVIRHLEILQYRGKVLLISGRDAATLREIEEIGRSRGLKMLPSLRKPFRVTDLTERLDRFEDSAEPEPAVTATERTEGGDIRKVTVDLEEARRNGWLELWYQPKIDLKTLSVCGAEALLRARHPRYGIVQPANLLPPAGDPSYHGLSRFVIRRAMIDWAGFASSQLALKLAINVPASVVLAPEFIGTLRELLPQDAKFPGLIVEITEDEVIRDAALIREIATQLKLYKAWISIDDFGAAYSSLSRLLELPCAELKIDRSFVSGCATDELKRTLCKTVVDLGHRFKASVCAEGVETADELRCMVDLGCDTAQGFLFARPMHPNKLVKMLLTRSRPTGEPAVAGRHP